MEAPGRLGVEELEGIAATDPKPSRAHSLNLLRQSATEERMAFAGQTLLRSSRQRLQDQSSGTGERIEHRRAGQDGHEPIEQGLAKPVRARTQPGHGRHGQTQAAQAPTDDADATRRAHGCEC